MDFELTRDQVILRDSVRRFAAKEIAPLVKEAERDNTIPKELLTKIAELGIFRIGQPERYGGFGGRVEECLIVEELSQVNAGIATIVIVQKVILSILFRLGSAAQIEEYALPMMEGRKLASIAVTEPNAGSDVKGIRTRAEKNGDGYRLTGTKMFTSMADICDFMLVGAYINRDIGFRGIGVFILDRETPGVSVNRIMKLVTCPASTNEVNFVDCPIRSEKLLGGEEGGFQNIMEIFNAERIMSGARSVGLSTAAYEAALKYAKDRVQFSKPIAEFQAIAFKLSDMYVSIEAARNLVYKAAFLYDSKKRYIKAASVAKLFATEMAQRVTLDAIQIHGGYGVTEEFPVAKYHRDSLIGTIGAGTSEMQRYVIAKEIGINIRF